MVIAKLKSLNIPMGPRGYFFIDIRGNELSEDPFHNNKLSSMKMLMAHVFVWYGSQYVKRNYK